MAIETSFAKKVSKSEDSHDRFLAALGNDGELDLALLDVYKPRPQRHPVKKQLGPCDISILFSHRPFWRENFSARMRASYSSSQTASSWDEAKTKSVNRIATQILPPSPLWLGSRPSATSRSTPPQPPHRQ
jgi:hypothetical protein